MEIQEIEDKRFDIALELLKEGVSDLVFNRVSFALNENTMHLEVRSFTTWLGKITANTASSDLQRGIETLSYLLENSRSFAEVVSSFPPRFSLIDDYGMGSVELCHLEDDTIVWNR